MNICILSFQTHLCGSLGGVSTHVHELSSIFVSLGHRVSVICPAHYQYPDIDYIEIIDNVLFYCIGGTSCRTLDHHWRYKSKRVFAELHERLRFHSVFFEGITHRDIFDEIKKSGIPYFGFLHNFALTHFYNVFKEIYNFRGLVHYFSYTVPHLIHKAVSVEIPFFRSCTSILSASLHNAERIKKFYRIKQDKVAVIPNWVDTDKFTPSPELRRAGRRRWHCPDCKIIFLFVGSLYFPKGLHIAIRSFGRLLDSDVDACLLVAGSGRHEKKLKDLAHKVGLIEGNSICFLGPVRHSLLPLLFNAADIFLMPSLFIEVLPYSLLEAMSCELPFISTTNAGCKEAMGDVGISIRPSSTNAMTDAMIYLARNVEERIRIGRLARNRVREMFSRQVAIDKINRLLMSIC